MQPEAELTVAVPSFNRQRSLTRLLGEICAQTRANDEVLVVDDGSADGSAEEAAKFARVRVFRHAGNRGMVQAWNSCLREARRDWICIVHDDDALAPSGLDVIRRVAEIRPTAGIIAHKSVPGVDGKLRFELCEAGPQAVLSSSLIPSGATVRRAAVEKLGVFDEQLKYSSDIEYFARIAAEFDLAIILNPAVVDYRIHSGNHQYATWRQADFLAQLGEIEDRIMRYTGLPESDRDALRRARWTGYLIHMFLATHRIDDRVSMRMIGRMLTRRPDVGRRLRMLALLASLFGRCPSVGMLRA